MPSLPMAFASPSELSTQLYSTTKLRTHHHRNTLLLIPPSQAFPKINGITIDPQAQPTTNLQLRVAYQGVPGAYSEFAAKTACPNCRAVPSRSFTEAILAVENGHADRAILPVESMLEGNCVRNYHLLLQHDLQIVQEVNLFVHYCLLAMPGVKRGELRRVISHPLALAHCLRSLARFGLDRVEPVDDTAGAVKLLLSRRTPDTGAIASSRAASLYGLDVVARGLQDESWNVTRFLVLSGDGDGCVNRMVGRVGEVVKTSLVMGHRGVRLDLVLGVLSAFSSRGINLTKLEVGSSINGKEGGVMILDVVHGIIEEFPHALYVDFEGSMDDEKVRDAVGEVSSKISDHVFVRVLGCYMADPNIYDFC